MKNKKFNLCSVFVGLFLSINIPLYANELIPSVALKNNNMTQGVLYALNDMQGHIDISEGKEQLSLWKKGQDNVAHICNNFIDDAKDGKIENDTPNFGKDALGQLVATYLYCSKMQGPCKFILDAMLELERARSFRNNKVSCSELKQFWKIWIDNNYDKQLNYDVNLGLIEKIKDFKTYELPKYIHCEQSIREMQKEGYVPSKEAINNVAKMSKLVTLLGKKFGDISSQFVSTK